MGFAHRLTDKLQNIALMAVVVSTGLLATTVVATDTRSDERTPFSLPVNIEFTVDDLRLPLNLSISDVSVSCDVLAVDDQEVVCPNATIRAANSPLGRIELAGAVAFNPINGISQLNAQASIGEQSSIRIDLVRGIDSTKLQVSIHELGVVDIMSIVETIGYDLRGHEFDSGLIDLSAACIVKGSRSECQVNGDLSNINFNGVNVAENLVASYRALLDDDRLSAEIEINDGVFYLEPGFAIGDLEPGFYLEPAVAPIALSVQLRRTDEHIHLENVQFSDNQALELRFNGDLVFAQEAQWQLLEFTMTSPDVAKFYATYMQPIALDTVFGSLETAGSISAKIVGSDNEIDGFEFNFSDVYVDDEQGRFALYGLDGDLILHDGESDKYSQLRFGGASLYRIQIGEGVIDWVSMGRSLKIAGWQNVAIFDGEIQIDTLAIENFSLDGSAIALSGTLTPITLSALTTAFDWIPMSGKISGHIPGLRFADNRVVLDGALRVNVFDGAIEIRDLTIDQLLSTVPVLKANVVIDDIDLEELTGTFSFGYMTGRLEGGIRDLELQAWRPTYFDALVRTVDDDRIRHRISQQAVDNLGRLGAGTGTGLSQGFLGFIPSYSYGQLGIGCRLVNGYCEMRGVKDADGDSFYILTRGGILPPWIDIKGSGRRISWQTLVDGIKQISRGTWELDIGG